MTIAKRGLAAHVERIMLGQSPPGIIYLPLATASAVYSAGLSARNLLYGSGLLSPFHASCRVISVGGLTLGGAGKTPLAIHIARLISKKKKVGILSRGYGQLAREEALVVSDGATLCPPPPYSADEPYMMARKLPTIPVVTAPKRASGAAVLVERFGVDVIILDDGFGHRALHRDMDIVLVDKHALDPARRKLFPLGYLREPPDSLARADVAVVMIRDADDENKVEEYTSQIRGFAGKDIHVAVARGGITGFATPEGKLADSIPGPALAFCGIADPGGFQRSLEEKGVAVGALVPFPDHHAFAEEDMTLLRQEAIRVEAVAVVTTEKDAARLTGRMGEFGKPLYVAQWELKLEGFEEEWVGL